ncbi:MAG: hypothetical protein M1838_002609 [Thelocarpon superellum]|nr:MAG: hypothetical protein M1838_002609 [Thelocarpon superellum]
MAGELVLITGVTGFIGFRVLVTALQAGYRVRGVIRRAEQAESLKATASVKPYVKQLEFVVVPDILKDGAFDEAVQDVVYIEHLASPLASKAAGPEDYQSELIEPAVKGTTGILASAKKSASVKRVVITSSAVTILSFKDLALVESDRVFSHKDTIEPESAPYVNNFHAYCASKSFALYAGKQFLATQQPRFDIIHVLPTFVIGKNELVTVGADYASSGTNSYAFKPLVGVQAASPLPGITVHVDDVAAVHVAALAPSVAGNQDFVVSSNGVEGTEWADALDIAASHFPAAVKDGRLPLGGSQPTKKLHIDASYTEQVFGLKFKTYEDQIVSLVGHYLELLG